LGVKIASVTSLRDDLIPGRMHIFQSRQSLRRRTWWCRWGSKRFERCPTSSPCSRGSWRWKRWPEIIVYFHYMFPSLFAVSITWKDGDCRILVYFYGPLLSKTADKKSANNEGQLYLTSASVISDKFTLRLQYGRLKLNSGYSCA